MDPSGITDSKSAVGRRVVGLGELGRWALATQEGQQRLDRLASGGRRHNPDELIFTDRLGAPLHHLLSKRARATASGIDAALGRHVEVETG
jgi:hypothetical protein